MPAFRRRTPRWVDRVLFINLILKKIKHQKQHHPWRQAESDHDLLAQFRAAMESIMAAGKLRQRDLFERLDTAGRGQITHSEFAAGLRRLGTVFSDSEAKRLAALIDAARRGSIEQSDIARVVRYKYAEMQAYQPPPALHGSFSVRFCVGFF